MRPPPLPSRRAPRPPVVAAAATPPTARPPPRAYRAVPLALLHVGRPRACPPTDALVGEWGTGVGRYAASFEEVCVRPPVTTKDTAAAVEAEGGRVLAAVGGADYVVLLDERGARVTSDGVADLLVRAGDRVKPGGRLVVGVGGAHGWSDAVRARADETIRVSDLVLNHRVARIVAAEALYRGFAILRGDPYHHV